MINHDAVFGLDETSFKLSQLEEEHKTLQWKYKELLREKMEVDHRLEEVVEKLSIRDDKLRRSGQEFQEDMESAADLAEKQNALTITLEAKVDIADSVDVLFTNELCWFRLKDSKGTDS